MRKNKQITDRLVAVPLVGSKDWLGGQNYIFSVISALASLNSYEKPRIRLVSLKDGDPALLEAMRRHEFVSIHPLTRLSGSSRFLRYLYKIAHKLVRLILGKKYNVEYKDVDVIFPVLSPSKKYGSPIYWIPDFQELYLPHFFSEQQLAIREKKNRSIIESDCVVVLSSYAALSDLKAHFSEIRAKVYVWHFCSNINIKSGEDGNPRLKYNLPHKYFYVPNQFWVHKNHEVVFRAIGRLSKIIPDIQLVCTGSTFDDRVKDHFSMLLRLIEEEQIVSNIKFLGILSRENQVELMRHSAFILQPSLFEGWSTVVEDVKAIGRPILLSNLSVHIEQNPPNAVYFDPKNVDDLSAKLKWAWQHWSAGPDIEAENFAQEELSKQVTKAGKELVKIVEGAIEYYD